MRSDGMQFDRMQFDRRGAIATGLIAGIAGARAMGTARKPGELRIGQGTNIALTVSPDGTHVAIDLYGLLWRLPVSGGVLTQLTGDFDDIGRPHWSPDGRHIAVQSYRDGKFRLWSVPAAGGPMVRLTPEAGFHDEREPRWSPDGQAVAFASDRSDGRYAIHILDMATGRVRRVSTGTGQHSEPAWSNDGRTIAYIEDGIRLMSVPLAGGPARAITDLPPSHDPFHPAGLRSPAFAPDGTLGWIRMDDGGITLVAGGRDLIVGEDLYPFAPAWTRNGMLYASGGQVRHRTAKGTHIVPFEGRVAVRPPSSRPPAPAAAGHGDRTVVGINAPALSPDGRQVAFGAVGDLWLMPIGGVPRRIVADDFYKAEPAWSPDGRHIAYVSDRSGIANLWVRDIAAGADRQLSFLTDRAAAAPAWAPDGRSIAFLDHDGALHRIAIDTGAVERLYEALWQPGRPSFGPGGETIALAAFRPTSARFREGASEILVIDVAGGQGRYAPIAPGKSIATRGLDGPVWSPDGRWMAYVFASRLWIVPVGVDGRLAGPARLVADEVADAPSWNGASSALLYLSNGRLRQVAIGGGAPRTIDCPLRFAAARAPARTILSVDRLWDGDGDRYRGPSDIVIEEGQIAAVVVRGSAGGASDERVDGSGLTALPGLVDMHTHRQMQGFGYGDRMGRLLLAMGITTTRSPGAPAYAMVEDREAIAAGRRTAPRHYATGEALDGSRIFYNFMRPVTEPGQLALELSRIEALSYDLVKTYVRLRHDVQAEVVAVAHAAGRPVTSHYHYPAIAHGVDAMEHMGATTRYGYSRTMTAGGAGYRDVTDLFAAAGAVRTTTLFAANVLLGEDDALVDDARVRALMPPWEQDKLTRRAAAMRTGDPAPILRSLAGQVAQVKAHLSAGRPMVIGTDAPIDFVAVSLHLNLRALVRFGLSPAEALRMATAHAGDALGAPLGRIARGQYADIILVEGDPLRSIGDAARVGIVLSGGRRHSPASLAAPFATRDTGRTSSIDDAARRGERGFWETAAYVRECRECCCQEA